MCKRHGRLFGAGFWQKYFESALNSFQTFVKQEKITSPTFVLYFIPFLMLDFYKCIWATFEAEIKQKDVSEITTKTMELVHAYCKGPRFYKCIFFYPQTNKIKFR